MGTAQQAYDQVHRECASLLFVAANNEKPELLGAVAASKLLGKISSHPVGLADVGSYQIPKQEVDNAGLNAARWEEAVKAGLLKKHGERTGAIYELPNMILVEENVVPTTLIAQLESLSGITHAQARRIAIKHPGKDKAAATSTQR